MSPVPCFVVYKKQQTVVVLTEKWEKQYTTCGEEHLRIIKRLQG